MRDVKKVQRSKKWNKAEKERKARAYRADRLAMQEENERERQAQLYWVKSRRQWLHRHPMHAMRENLFGEVG